MPSYSTLFALAAMSSLVYAQDVATPTVSSWSASGNGCPQGVKFSEVRASGSTTWLHFDATNFTTAIGPNSTVYDHTKNCELHINLALGSSWSVAPVGFQAVGHAYLEENVTATFFGTYYDSQDASDTVTTQTSISGGGAWDDGDGQDFFKQDLVPSKSYIWSACGENPIVNANVRVALTSSDADASGTVALKKEDGLSWSLGIGLQWKGC